MEQKLDNKNSTDKTKTGQTTQIKSALSAGSHEKTVRPVTIALGNAGSTTNNTAPGGSAATGATTGAGGDKAKPKTLKLTKATGAKGKTAEGGGDADDFDAWMKSRQLLKPDDQLDLTEAELSEEITRVLTPKNTNVIENLVIYSFKEGMFVKVPPAGNLVTLVKFAGTSIHVDSEEAKLQMERTGEIGIPLSTTDYTLSEFDVRASSMQKVDDDVDEEEVEDVEEEEEQKDIYTREIESHDGEEEVEEEEQDEAKADETEEAPHTEEIDATTDILSTAPVRTKKHKLINQFNSCERAALTHVYPKRAVETQTIPPPRSQYSNNVLQWTIYDSYAEDYHAQHLHQKEKDKKDERRASQRREDGISGKDDKASMSLKLNQKYLKCWQILERMINQNIYKEIAHDYRYWEDPADEYREFEGTLLPLWKFQYDPTKKMTVTTMVFNPEYYDLFAVGFGSFDFMKQPSRGAVCLFTVKNPSYPDYIINTECGVTCVDIHSKYPFLLVLGLYDGNVAVYDLKDNYKDPLYASMGETMKHSECVRGVSWGHDMADGEINFYSVSNCGRIFHWVLMQNKLLVTSIFTLYLENGIVDGPDETEVQLINCGCSMKFHPNNPEFFLVGTEMGYIYKCSTTYSSKYLMKYNAHNLSVYSMDYNRFNSNIFISCSEDWRVKIWEDMRPQPLLIFDLGAAVGDVKWAPYSSTVFAAVTNEGKVHVFDLNVNKYKPICVQAVVRKQRNKLTRLAFNEKLPFIIMGDDKGTVTSLKLSPNLRLMVKPPKKQLHLDQNTLQIQKLDRLLSLVRELPEGAVMTDTAAAVKS